MPGGRRAPASISTMSPSLAPNVVVGVVQDAGWRRRRQSTDGSRKTSLPFLNSYNSSASTSYSIMPGLQACIAHRYARRRTLAARFIIDFFRALDQAHLVHDMCCRSTYSPGALTPLRDLPRTSLTVHEMRIEIGIATHAVEYLVAILQQPEQGSRRYPRSETCVVGAIDLARAFEPGAPALPDFLLGLRSRQNRMYSPCTRPGTSTAASGSREVREVIEVAVHADRDSASRLRGRTSAVGRMATPPSMCCITSARRLAAASHSQHYAKNGCRRAPDLMQRVGIALVVTATAPRRAGIRRDSASGLGLTPSSSVPSLQLIPTYVPCLR